MSKKPDTASALAGILKARRGDETTSEPDATAAVASPDPVAPPSPALPPPPPPIAPPPPVVARKARTGKSSDKATYSQFSVYLRKDTRKKVGRALEDRETGQDFSELVQDLLEQWLASST